MTTPVGNPDGIDMELGERYYKERKDEEERLTSEIIDVIRQFIDRRCREGRRPALRDAHAKDNGCVKAIFRVDSDLKHELQHGVFIPGKEYKAWIRFSNANSEPRNGRLPDGRGMAVKLMGVKGDKLLHDEAKTQDFIMINHPVFFVDDLQRYKETLDKFLNARSMIGQYLCVLKLNGRERWLALKSNLSIITNPLFSQYWSMTPYCLGVDSDTKTAIKFTAKPRLKHRDNFLIKLVTWLNPTFTLKNEMDRSLSKREAQFDLFVQRYVDDRTPIEDSTIEWTESISKLEHVATITIPPQKLISSERDAFCENLSFSPWHCLPAHKPLGAVNRVRKTVYLTISEQRHRLNIAPKKEPTGDESFQKWEEKYAGDGPEAERVIFDAFAREIQDIQLRNKRKSGTHEIERALCAKSILAATNARLRVLPTIPPQFQVGYFQPGVECSAMVRLSTGDGTGWPYHLRGFALRVNVSDGKCHDLLMTNAPVAPARDGRQFVAFMSAMSGPKLLILPRLLVKVGLFETIRIRRLLNDSRISAPQVNSLALENYWSGGAIRWGDANAVRYMLWPREGVSACAEKAHHGPYYLHDEMASRLRKEDVVYDFLVQPFIDEERTPIEDGAVEWPEKVSAPIPLATLTIPQQDIDSAGGRIAERLVEHMAFNPWHTTDEFRPLGNLNRARKAVYGASSSHRLGYQFRETIPLRNVICGGFIKLAFGIINRFRPWHELGWRLGLLNLSSYRDVLRERNLFDTQPREAPPKPAPISAIPERVRTFRTYDGRYNDIADPNMGSLGSTFGRCMTPVYRPNLFDEPNPIVVSDELLSRKRFIPARSLNMLAASWIQFQVHDWVNHQRYRLGENGGKNDVIIPRPAGKKWADRKWKNRAGDAPEAQMRIAGNKVFCTAPAGYPVFANQTTPWWDGSEVYGDHEASANSLRQGPFIKLTEDRYLSHDIQGNAVTGFNESWWLGLSMLHTLFAREHNVLCEALLREYPAWDSERVYQTARLIVSALIAKIHTVEWTPAILAAKTIEIGLPANWYGAPKDWRTQLGVWLVDAHALKGIPQTLPNHHGVPYSLTEEFASVYRLHPLIPDDYQFFDHRDGKLIGTHTFTEIQGTRTDDRMRRLKLSNVIYSFGIAHPGAITLHNYPRALQKFQRSGGDSGYDTEVIDLPCGAAQTERPRVEEIDR